MDVSSYLARIHYDGPLDVSLETLRELHKAHLRTVPFEDLDVYLQHPIVLSESVLFEKIVYRKRGGFCYELNGLFAGLLRGLGFRVTLLSGQVYRKDAGVFGPPFDHLALMIELDRRWLGDVGFPRSATIPLLLDTDEPQECDGTSYRICAEGGFRTLMQRTSDGWEPEYRFDVTPRALDDFEEMCRFHATSPESPFHRWLGCTLATDDGRVTLSDDKLIVRSGGERTESAVVAHEIPSILRSRFGITLEHDWR